jgi:hypothetical protein
MSICPAVKQMSSICLQDGLYLRRVSILCRCYSLVHTRRRDQTQRTQRSLYKAGDLVQVDGVHTSGGGVLEYIQGIAKRRYLWRVEARYVTQESQRANKNESKNARCTKAVCVCLGGRWREYIVMALIFRRDTDGENTGQRPKSMTRK